MRLKPVRKIILALLALVVVAGGAVGYFFVQLTASPTIELRQAPNAVEGREATRKLQLFEEAGKAKRRGYIRLSEVEMNSYLDETVLTNNIETNGIVLLNARVLLDKKGCTWVSWLDMPFFGFELPLVWQRHLDLVKNEEGYGLKLVGMQVGQMQIPPEQWGTVHEYLGHFDGIFQERFGWMLEVPTVLIEKNELSKAPELRLYTYVPEETKK